MSDDSPAPSSAFSAAANATPEPAPAETQTILLHLTAQHQAIEAALRESEERFRGLVETCFDWVWESDATGCYTYCNPRVRDLLGHAPEEIVGEPVTRFLAAEAHPAGAAAFASSIEARAPIRALELVHRHSDGRLLTFEINAQPVRGPDDRWLGYRGFSRDVTRQRRAERYLHLHDAALEAAANAIVITDQAGTIEWANPAFATLSGWSLDEAIGRNPRDLIKSGQHPPEFYRAMWETILAGQVWRGEMVNRRKDGSLRTEDITITPLRDEHGAVSHFIAIKQDITDQKRLEAHLLQTQRTEALGTLAGGIAHDLNNILSPILMVASLIRNSLPDEHDRELVAMVESNARRGASIIKQLLTFSRGQAGQRAVVQPRHLLKELLQIMRETFPREIQVTDRFPRDLWTITADPAQIHQILLNLCVNARDAMPRGGCLTVAAENLELAPGDLALAPGVNAGPFVVLEIRDTGDGIAPEIQHRIFDPFFTTKPLGSGTGLGLSTVLGIVRNHGGFVTVVSTPGCGSSFRVHLPATPAALLDPADPLAGESAADPGPADAAPLILVVEDEAHLRDTVRLVLEQSRYRVATAADGRQALAEYLARRPDVALVVTDLMMPGLNGVDFVRALRALDPQIGIIATTGVIEEHRIRELATLAVTEILPKPCDVRTLLDAVARRVRGPGTPVNNR